MSRPCGLLTLSTVAVIAAMCCMFSPSVVGQSGYRTRVDRRPHYERLWDWLKKTDYRKWQDPRGEAPEFAEGQSPHGAWLKTYVSKLAAKDLQDLPHGSVIVKENFNAEKKLVAITVMQRAKGYDSKHGDWYYVKYLPSGKIARTPPDEKNLPIAGRWTSCIECHADAADNDFVFFND